MKLGIESERNLKLVSPPPPLPPKKPEPPTVPQLRVPRAAPIPRIDPVSDRPLNEMTDGEVTRSMFEIVMDLNRDFPTLIQNVQENTEDIRALDRKVSREVVRLDKKIDAARIRPELNIEDPDVVPTPSPSGHDLVVKATDYVRSQERGLAVARERDSLRAHVDTIEQRLMREEQAKVIAAAELKGAQDFANRQKEIREATAKRMGFWLKVLSAAIPIMTAAGGAIAWALHR